MQAEVVSGPPPQGRPQKDSLSVPMSQATGTECPLGSLALPLLFSTEVPPAQPCHARLLTSTQVSISGNWLMMGSTASMELPGRRSDLLPTRMMGTLQRGPWSSRTRELEENSPPGPYSLPGPLLSPSIHQRDPFGSDLKGKGWHEVRGLPSPQLPTELEPTRGRWREAQAH